MLLFDAHNDLLTKIYSRKCGLGSNVNHIDFRKMPINQHVQHAICCAIFLNIGFCERAYALAHRILDFFISKLGQYHEVAGILEPHKPINILLSFEGADATCGDPMKLEEFYQRGVRAMSLSWNLDNMLAGGCLENRIGITAAGRGILQKMQELDMVLDFAHIGERAFFEALDYFPGKIIVSHSNAKKICNHNRNLTDEQIRRVAQRGGVIGVNLYPPFLTEGPEAGIKDILAHIEYIAGLVGVDFVGFGFDFDGVEQLPRGIAGIEDVNKILEELGKLNYTETEIEKICGKNFSRIFLEPDDGKKEGGL